MVIWESGSLDMWSSWTCVCVCMFLHGRNIISWEQNVKRFPNFYALFTLSDFFYFNTVAKTNLFEVHNVWAIVKVCV